MARIGPRIARLELARPAQRGTRLELTRLDLDTLDAMAAAHADMLTCPGPDTCDAALAGPLDRVERMQAQGLGLADLSDWDLALIVAMGEAERGRS